MIHQLYKDDSFGKEMSDSNIDATIKRFQEHPDNGLIWVAETGGKLIGYAIVVNFWSNEYSGLLQFIDELFIEPEYRNKGIGEEFINQLMTDKTSSYKAILLEVNPENERAFKFYQRLGFTVSEQKTLIKEISN